MDALTPMLRQYRQVKSEHPDAILMFRLGDFYEMFYDDALVASRALSLTLTARGRGTASEAPMCGVPYHAADGYIARLVGRGYRVAVCDQVEDARQAKGIVRRAVTRVVSPGTFTDPAHLPAREPNYIASIVSDHDGERGALSAAGDGASPAVAFGCAVLDLSTGDFRISEHRGAGARDALGELLAGFAPREIVHREGAAPDAVLPRERLEGLLLTAAPSWRFARDAAYRSLLERFGTSSLEGFGCEGKDLAIAAAGALLAHLQETQKTDLRHVTRVVWQEASDVMMLDAATRRTLEIVENARDGGRDGTLLAVIDRTRTAMGGRLLRDWLVRPLTRREPIEARLTAVALLAERPAERTTLAALLDQVHDLERLLGRCALGTATARDLVALRDSLRVLPAIAEHAIALATPLLSHLLSGLDVLGDLHTRLQEAVADDPPATLREGRMIRDGFNAGLDELRTLRRDSQGVLAAIETRERQRTGIGSLKVRYNKVFGYSIEVSNANRSLVPPDYVRKQTLVGGERYITPELKDLEHRVLTAEERIVALEYEMFVALREAVAGQAARLRATAGAIAALDALLALALTAADGAWIRPRIVEEPRLSITEGRHPVVERLLRGERFVPNDCLVDATERQILILTGPNMGGKSTYLRQVALIALLAQAGSFVPAAAAEVGLVDRIFSRVGASDNLARGQSTFLVEMNETANILNNATARSLILLDEVGRGTSTFDGLSIAWSVAEHLHDTPRVAARTLFATHYHELTELALTKKRVVNLKMLVREWNDSIVFLRKVVEGSADRSYGIQVARLAGLPHAVLERAREVLSNLEREELARDGRPKLARHAGDGAGSAAQEPAQIGLFAPEEDPVIGALRAASLETMTPIEALNFLAGLKERLGR
jgi:DNA mismatch repair protein MutS